MPDITEHLRGIVQRVTYHNGDTGWSVLRVTPFNSPGGLETVTVHQTQVFAGATMEFHGAWTVHPQFGRQFKALRAIEKKPATTAALEKYLGSGLIHGVGPKTAGRIVRNFRENTLDIFEHDIGRLLEVPGIAQKKLRMIEEAWREHRVVREVMLSMHQGKISAGELAAAKANLTGGFAHRMDSNSKRVGLMSMIGFYGLPLDYLQNWARNINNVTVDQVKAESARFLDASQWNIVQAGPEVAGSNH